MSANLARFPEIDTCALEDLPNSLHNTVDFSQGKLLYCHPPPHINAEDFQQQHSSFQKRDCDDFDLSTNTNKQKIKRIENVVDKSFFHQV